MRPQIKLATCCYCGGRTMLKPTARGGHELACGACGAPLHEMKWLKVPATEAPAPAPAKVKPAKFKRKKPEPARASRAAAFFGKPDKPRKVKKRKPFWRRALEEVWDEIEDVFD